MKTKPRKILIVDDSPVMQKMTRQFFENNHYEVYSAWDGAECIKLAKKVKPDAILLDVILPDADGKLIAQSLKNDPQTRDIAIIFTTNTVSLKHDKGYESFEIDGELFRAFAKPLHYPKIINVVKKEVNRTLQGGKLSPKIRPHNHP